MCNTSYTSFHTGHEERVEEKPFACQLCEKKYLSNNELRNHIQKHHREEYENQKDFKCSQCNKRYSTLGNLNDHMNKHTGFKPKCPICNETFSGKPALSKHKGRKHGNVYPHLAYKYGKERALLRMLKPCEVR